jgi:hypothetical protein
MRARALREPVFLSSFPKRGAARPPPSSQLRCFLFDLQIYIKSTKYLHMKSTELCLASSKILTPQPLSTQRVCPPPVPKAGGYIHTRREVRECGRSIFWKTPDIGLASYSIISLQYNLSNLGRPRQWFFSFHWTTEVVKYEVPCPPPPHRSFADTYGNILRSTVRPYAPNFFCFFLFYIVF